MKGQRRNPERIFLERLKKGDVFYTKKTAKDMTSLASIDKVKILTEVGYYLHPATLDTCKLTKVTIL